MNVYEQARVVTLALGVTSMHLVRAQGQRASLLICEDQQILFRVIELDRRLELLRVQGFIAAPSHT